MYTCYLLALNTWHFKLNMFKTKLYAFYSKPVLSVFPVSMKSTILHSFTQARNPKDILEILFSLLFNPSPRPVEFLEILLESSHLSIFTTATNQNFSLHQNNLLNDFPTFPSLQPIPHTVMIVIFSKHNIT